MDAPEPRYEIEDELRAAEFERLYGTARMQLRRGLTDSAAQAAEELLERWPDSTTAHELMGDVLCVQGKVDEALAAFAKAKGIEPANVDAERKYAALMLKTGEVERRRERMAKMLDDPAAHVKHKRSQPMAAMTLALVFPGFGQVYNDDYMKGLGLFSGAFVILVLLIGELVITPYTAAMRTHGGRRHISVGQQLTETGDALASFGLVQWTLVFVGVVTLIGLYVYGVWDALKTARQAQAEQDDLGIG
jgi:tetratricopeptide (TPR) repeat protein